MKTEKETAEIFHNFFGNIVKNLNISQYYRKRQRSNFKSYS